MSSTNCKVDQDEKELKEDDGEVEELNPSQLGTKEYWSEAYSKEIENFEDHGDVGEVWFGEEAGTRMVNWLSDHPEYVSTDSSILDVGCGNGMLCVDLCKEGFTKLLGVDYCQEAVDLSRRVSEQEDCGPSVEFSVCDILEELSTTTNPALLGQYDVVLDKGTYDAISLAETAVKDKSRYVTNMAQLLCPQGLLLITSCNWTKEELVSMFSPAFKVKTAIPTPSFSFGGKSGNMVTSIVFQKAAS